MRIIAINGSPRKNGNTATILKGILEGAAEKGAETRFIHINGLDMKGCQGCLACRENLGVCAYKDEFQDVLEEMRKCDGLAMGTPIYGFNVSGQFKCFLDRTYCFVDDSNPPAYPCVLPAGKKIAVVTSQGDDNPESYRHIIDYLQMLGTIMGASSVEVITQVGTQDKGDAAKDAELMEKARAVGRAMAS